MRKSAAILLTTFCLVGIARAQASRQLPPFDPQYPTVHDPVMAVEDGVCHLYCTGFGISHLTSADMKTWTLCNPVLDPIPEWARQLVPAYKGHTWAPDIIRHGDRWYLYYSCSTFGKNISVIGVMSSPALSGDDALWTDHGEVIRSRPGADDWNAIDPNAVIDGEGNAWLTFGSFWDGIQLVRLEADMQTPAGRPSTIARRRCACQTAHFTEDANTNAIEAPFIIRHEGYYYLFVSYDYCCRGLDSTYKTAVGRSRDISGPYVDKSGVDMLDGGGEIIIGENDRYAGVGHCSIYDIGDTTIFLAHAYDKELNGASKLLIKKIRWDNGWPVLTDIPQ